MGRLDITMLFHSPRLRLFEFLGQSFAIQAAARLAFPVSVVRLASKSMTINNHSKAHSFQALHWSVEATCMLDRGLTSLELTPSQNKSVVVASHHQLLRAVRREILEQGLSFEGAASVLDVGLDANAGHRTSVKIQNKREQKCRKRNAPIKVLQIGLKLQTPNDEAVSKTGSCQLSPTGTLGWACARVLPST